MKAYDPTGYELVRSTFRLSPEQDWRYRFPRKMPQVESPPAKFKIDPYYTKFSYARELIVLGCEASDESILSPTTLCERCLPIVRIFEGIHRRWIRVVVLGREERLSDLPEFRNVEGLGRCRSVEPLLRVFAEIQATRV